MTREDLIDVLKTSIATVVFTKVDGSTRVMKCTLQEDFLPPLVGSNHKRSQEVVPVWSILDKAWRSFRLDSLISIKVEEE